MYTVINLTVDLENIIFGHLRDLANLQSLGVNEGGNKNGKH